MENLLKAIKRADTVYICGNGGSAANAEHFSNDLFKKGIKAICLNSNVSLITMIANDYGYEHIFSKQLNLFASSRDLLITISCSGLSSNITGALVVAKLKSMSIYEFPIFKTYDEHTFKEYGLLENKHLELIHQVTSEL